MRSNSRMKQFLGLFSVRTSLINWILRVVGMSGGDFGLTWRQRWVEDVECVQRPTPNASLKR